MNSCSKLGGTVGKYRQEGGGQGYISKHILDKHSASVIHGMNTSSGHLKPNLLNFYPIHDFFILKRFSYDPSHLNL